MQTRAGAVYHSSSSWQLHSDKQHIIWGSPEGNSSSSGITPVQQDPAFSSEAEGIVVPGPVVLLPSSGSQSSNRSGRSAGAEGRLMREVPAGGRDAPAASARPCGAPSSKGAPQRPTCAAASSSAAAAAMPVAGSKLAQRQPEWSVGAELHDEGKCRPCGWHWKQGGCSKAENCVFCHMCQQGEIKVRRKDRLNRLKEIKRERHRVMVSL